MNVHQGGLQLFLFELQWKNQIITASSQAHLSRPLVVQVESEHQQYISKKLKDLSCGRCEAKKVSPQPCESETTVLKNCWEMKLLLLLTARELCSLSKLQWGGKQLIDWLARRNWHATILLKFSISLHPIESETAVCMKSISCTVISCSCLSTNRSEAAKLLDQWEHSCKHMRKWNCRVHVHCRPFTTIMLNKGPPPFLLGEALQNPNDRFGPSRGDEGVLPKSAVKSAVSGWFLTKYSP